MASPKGSMIAPPLATGWPTLPLATTAGECRQSRAAMASAKTAAERPVFGGCPIGVSPNGGGPLLHLLHLLHLLNLLHHLHQYLQLLESTIS